MAKTAFALIYTFIAAFVCFPAISVMAQTKPASITIVGEGIGDGMRQGYVPIPAGNTVNIRLVGKDKAGKTLKLDPNRIVWKMKHKHFPMTVSNGVARVTALADPFGSIDAPPVACKDPKICPEPNAWLMASYDGLSAGVQVAGVLNVKGKWLLTVSGDKRDIEIVKLSGRWVKDTLSREGTVQDNTLLLYLPDVPIKTPIGWMNFDLHPKVTFTSRTSGKGYAQAMGITEHFTIVKVE